MDITIGELIDRVQSVYSKGVKSDDSRLSNRHIYSVLKSTRNYLVTQQVKKRQKISDWNFVVLSCIELIQVPNHDCPCVPNIGCNVYRTKHKLPKTLTDLNKHIIQWVMSVDSGKIISETTRDTYIYSSGNKMTVNNLQYILENGYIYVYGKAVPKMIKVKILAEDPVEAYNFPSKCACTDCDEDCTSIMDKPFPIDGDLIKPLIEMSATELLEWFNKSTEDITNNTSDTNDKNRQ